MPQSDDLNNRKTSIKQKDATSFALDTEQGWSISSQVIAINATEKKKYGMIRNPLVLRKKTTTRDENKIFYMG